MKQKYELLAPVGNFAMLHAAIGAGADAVYFGIKGFNMRDTARNFTIADLKKIKELCTPKKVKRYLTLNTIIYDEELKKVETIIKKSKGLIDAIICWDLAVINLCRKYKVPFHVSTQASISNTQEALFYKKLGATKIVLARELSLKQIKKISKQAKIPIECFCHGAMCVSVSGRCFTSQFIHGISANRGQCAQPCRRAWEVKDDQGNKLKLQNNRVMSAKDLCTLPFIDKMKKAGITTFKIEGRNRSPEYVSTVVKEYKKALDKKPSHKEIVESINSLKKVYHRGFSSGFFFKMPTNDDFSFSEHGEQEEYKERVARIERYWPKAEAASVKMLSGKLKVGDEVYIISEDAPIKRLTIESMEIKNKPVKQAIKGQDVGIKLPKCHRRDEIFLIKKKR
ncbi:U32 family peptidase [archaeon]|jgi:U32 family peptidase|nr:U32 family peptidase [archaeon]MBT3577998.1 U32 family peptidase [archaeon]MBT6820601.1 U32 family peptidase [archaeon]MBT6956536.1 U32 family peptidase [archaeon]MBT7025852.1 U32 family peptidase [archaeon]